MLEPDGFSENIGQMSEKDQAMTGSTDQGPQRFAKVEMRGGAMSIVGICDENGKLIELEGSSKINKIIEDAEKGIAQITDNLHGLPESSTLARKVTERRLNHKKDILSVLKGMNNAFKDLYTPEDVIQKFENLIESSQEMIQRLKQVRDMPNAEFTQEDQEKLVGEEVRLQNLQDAETHYLERI